jgi:molybdenum cofactor synthesis domain-containing protein
MTAPRTSLSPARQPVTAALLIIGNEILSGRTVDQNLNFLAVQLSEAGITLQECRVIADDIPTIVRHLQELSRQYSLVFTSGGIGPTHDDMTAEAVAIAFDCPLEPNQIALDRLLVFYGSADQLTPARRKMALLPRGCGLIDNPVSSAPGFVVGNVYIMAGIPRVFQSMVSSLLPSLSTGQAFISRTIRCPVGESLIADILTDGQAAYPSLQIGSYPYIKDGMPHTAVVTRGQDTELVGRCTAALFTQIQERVPDAMRDPA